MVQDIFKPGSHVNNAEGLGSSWVSVPELAAAHAASEGFGTGEKLVVGKDCGVGSVEPQGPAP